LYPELSGAVVGGGAAEPSADQQFADKCQEASAQHEICSSDTIKVKSDANALFDAKPGELVCRTGQKRNNGSEERVYFASEPRGYAWVANPDQNICDKQ
jgi:hypothetical protein